MAAPTCPNCKVLLRRSDLANRQCNHCGETLPAFVTAPPTPAPRPTIRLGRPTREKEEEGRSADASPSSRPLASLKTRLAGAVVDLLVLVFVVGPGVVIMFGAAGPKDEAMMILIGVVVGLLGLVLLLATQINLLTRDGQTVGKRAVGSRIVSHEDGSNPGFVRAVLLRSGVPFLIVFIPALLGPGFPTVNPWIPLIGTVFSVVDVGFIFGKERRCLHDRIAGTKVVQV